MPKFDIKLAKTLTKYGMILRYEFRCQGKCGNLYEKLREKHEFDKLNLRLLPIARSMS